jgi:hypothetical protein
VVGRHLDPGLPLHERAHLRGILTPATRSKCGFAAAQELLDLAGAFLYSGAAAAQTTTGQTGSRETHG